MYITCLDLEGVLVPEIWIAFADAVGIPELRRTTRDEPNYDKLILSDRSFISGLAYAMANDDNLDIKTLIELNKFALCSDFGDKFVFLKASKDLIRQRLFNRATSDDIESRGIEYLMRVQEFMSIILTDLKFDLLEIDASLKPEIIQDKIRKFI